MRGNLVWGHAVIKAMSLDRDTLSRAPRSAKMTDAE
jgi:hypothetical protein